MPADDTPKNGGEMPPETPEQPSGETPQSFEDWLDTQPDDVKELYSAEVGGLKKALAAERAQAKEAAKQLKKLQQLEDKERLRQEAEMSELERFQAENERLTKTLQQLETESLKREIAQEVGLPEAFAARIRGADRDEMTADAQAMLEALPAQPEPEKKKPPQIKPTNPITGQEAGETPAQRRNRLYGGGAGSIFSPAEAAQKGGGVIYHGDD